MRQRDMRFLRGNDAGNDTGTEAALHSRSVLLTGCGGQRIFREKTTSCSGPGLHKAGVCRDMPRCPFAAIRSD